MDSPSLQAAASLHQIRARWRSDIPGFSRWNNEGSPKVRRIHARRSSMCSPFETVTPTVRSNFGQSISAFGSRAISSDGQIARFKGLSRDSRSPSRPQTSALTCIPVPFAVQQSVSRSFPQHTLDRIQLKFSGPQCQVHKGNCPPVFQIAPVSGKQATGVYVAVRGESV